MAEIGRMANLIAVSAATGLTRLIETATVNVVEPAVIETAQAAIFKTPITEIRPSVRAVKPEQA
jgi:hypothetical protein